MLTATLHGRLHVQKWTPNATHGFPLFVCVYETLCVCAFLFGSLGLGFLFRTEKEREVWTGRGKTTVKTILQKKFNEEIKNKREIINQHVHFAMSSFLSTQLISLAQTLGVDTLLMPGFFSGRRSPGGYKAAVTCHTQGFCSSNEASSRKHTPMSYVLFQCGCGGGAGAASGDGGGCGGVYVRVYIKEVRAPQIVTGGCEPPGLHSRN